MNKITLKAEKREVFGRKVKSLRKNKIIPGNIFGKGIESYAIQVLRDDFVKVYEEAGETGIVQILVDGKEKPVLIHELHRNPVDAELLHVDFIQVDLKVKISAAVPVEIIGESPAEKQGLGTVVQQIDEIEVEALPADLPEKFQIDISQLSEVDQAIYVKNLEYDKSKVELQAESEEIIVKVEPQREEEPEPTPEPAVSEEAVVAEEASGETSEEKPQE